MWNCSVHSMFFKMIHINKLKYPTRVLYPQLFNNNIIHLAESQNNS